MFLAVFMPYYFELYQVIPECLQDIIVWKIVHPKLLNNDHNEQVEHHIGANHDKWNKKDW